MVLSSLIVASSPGYMRASMKDKNFRASGHMNTVKLLCLVSDMWKHTSALRHCHMTGVQSDTKHGPLFLGSRIGKFRLLEVSLINLNYK
jgi:hypothetical protein